MTNPRPFTCIHRLLHWCLALSIMLILLTVALRNGWMDKYYMGEMIQKGVIPYGFELSKEQAIQIAKSIRNNMYQWHIWAGYSIGVILVLRGIYFFKVGVFYRDPKLPPTIHEKIQGMIYGSFYILCFLSVSTGLLFYYGSKEYVPHIVKEIHELSLWYVIPFLCLHILGMILSEVKDKSNIVSKMFGSQ